MLLPGQLIDHTRAQVEATARICRLLAARRSGFERNVVEASGPVRTVDSSFSRPSLLRPVALARAANLEKTLDTLGQSSGCDRDAPV